MSLPLLNSHAVQVWRFKLSEIADTELAQCQHYLSEEERARARAFHFEADRRRYFLAYGKLRILLSQYLEQDSQQVAPQDLIFQKGPQGKPYFNEVHQFNLSHSGDYLLLAFGKTHALGIDVEMHQARTRVLALARRFFATAEIAYLEGLPEARRSQGFYDLWTQKEALLKAQGLGLAQGLAHFSVLGQAPFLEVWQMISLTMPPGYSGSLCVQQEVQSVIFPQSQKNP